MWEQRYGLLTPQRTDTNIRYYLDDDLKLLLNIALLKKSGLRISKIAKMSHQEIAERVAGLTEINMGSKTQLDAMTISMMQMDEAKFDRIISTNIKQLGFERTMLEVIYPFLEKLSVLWLTGSIDAVQENFISYLIRQKIIAAIDAEPLAAADRRHKFIIYLPEGEQQELSLLFMHYLIKSRKYYPLYLGQDITISDLEDTCAIHQPKYIFTMITETFGKESVTQYLERLSDTFPDCHILVSGYQVVAQQVSSAGNLHVLQSLGQVIEWLDERQPLLTKKSSKSTTKASATS